MSDHIENEELEFSLADLAAIDAGEVAEVRFESLPAGLYIFRGESAILEDTTNRDDERRIVLVVKLEVVECKAVTERGYDKEELIGKKHTEKFYVVPNKATEGLGLIRAFISDVGLPSEGAFGGVPGSDPGIIDGLVDHEFPGKIIKQARKGDASIKDARLRLDPPKRK